jgi:hypothetical protein
MDKEEVVIPWHSGDDDPKTADAWRRATALARDSASDLA